jgi:hypothetical protein
MVSAEMGIIEADHEYYIIELEKITLDLVEWLNSSFGPPTGRWWLSNYRIYFRDKRDHLMCVLRWS